MMNESQQWNLMIVTKNGYRVYINFELKEVSDPTFDEILRENAVNDVLVV